MFYNFWSFLLLLVELSENCLWNWWQAIRFKFVSLTAIILKRLCFYFMYLRILWLSVYSAGLYAAQINHFSIDWTAYVKLDKKNTSAISSGRRHLVSQLAASIFFMSRRLLLFALLWQVFDFICCLFPHQICMFDWIIWMVVDVRSIRNSAA